jgi:DNA invertase Pin-like site-specific DNA recombinase
MARMSVMMLALFAEMERVWNRERVAHAREKAGRSPGRKKALTAAQVDLAVQMRAAGATVPMICKAVGEVGRSTVYRAFAEHRPCRQPRTPTAGHAPGKAGPTDL